MGVCTKCRGNEPIGKQSALDLYQHYLLPRIMVMGTARIESLLTEVCLQVVRYHEYMPLAERTLVKLNGQFSNLC